MRPQKCLGLIPARKGSLRVQGKNIRPLAGHPLIAYSIRSAIESEVFDRVVVSTDCEKTKEIALYYGAEVPFLRPTEFATSKSIDVEWISHAFKNLGERFDMFAILRPTSPFRTAKTIKRAFEAFCKAKDTDSIRAVELCHEHPGKMWKVTEQGKLESFLEQGDMEKPWHARQYQDLPKVYIQNSALEMAKYEVIEKYNSREGKIISPFFTEGHEGIAVDYQTDWDLCELIAAREKEAMPHITMKPYSDL